MPNIFLPIFLVLSFTSLNIQAVDFTSTEKQATLVELFTSEGCSSCPPADHWLGALKKDPRLWKEIIPLAFHVDYWNYLGWEDPYSKASHSARQRHYSQQGYARTVYTPGFFKNGREWRAWFRSRDLGATVGRNVGPLKVRLENGQLRAIFEPTNLSFISLQLNVALLGMNIVNKISSGENDGKTLRHNFVVFEMSTFPSKLEKGQLRWKVDYAPSQFLSSSTNNNGQQALAVWVTRPNNPTPLQAVGGLLP